MVVLGGCVSFFVGTAFQATMPEFAHDLGTDKADFAYSALLGANAAGAVVGGFLLEGRAWLPPNVKTAISSAILWCAAIAAFALSSNYYLVVGAAVCRRCVESDLLVDGPDDRAAAARRRNCAAA